MEDRRAVTAHEARAVRSVREEPQFRCYGRHGGRTFSTRRLTVDGRTYEADADGKVYSVEHRQRRRVRDPEILRQIDQQLRAESAARAAAEAPRPAGAESAARRAGREAALRAMQAAAAVGAVT